MPDGFPFNSTEAAKYSSTSRCQRFFYWHIYQELNWI